MVGFLGVGEGVFYGVEAVVVRTLETMSLFPSLEGHH